MQQMQVAATVPGGQTMMVNVNGMHMDIVVPPEVEVGQTFAFAVPEQTVMAQPVMAQPMMQPVMAQPMSAQGRPVAPVAQGVEMQPMTAQAMVPPHAAGPAYPGVPPGAPPGGQWEADQYCGGMTLIMAILCLILFWPLLFLCASRPSHSPHVVPGPASACAPRPTALCVRAPPCFCRSHLRAVRPPRNLRGARWTGVSQIRPSHRPGAPLRRRKLAMSRSLSTGTGAREACRSGRDDQLAVTTELWSLRADQVTFPSLRPSSCASPII